MNDVLAKIINELNAQISDCKNAINQHQEKCKAHQEKLTILEEVLKKIKSVTDEAIGIEL